jgi:hypothetical protein
MHSRFSCYVFSTAVPQVKGSIKVLWISDMRSVWHVCVALYSLITQLYSNRSLLHYLNFKSHTCTLLCTDGTFTILNTEPKPPGTS